MPETAEVIEGRNVVKEAPVAAGPDVVEETDAYEVMLLQGSVY